MICTHCHRDVDYVVYADMLTRDELTAFEKAIKPFCDNGGDYHLFEVPKCPTCYTPSDWLLYVTKAPDAYDGFGTKTIGHAESVFGTVRLVAIDPQAERWQTSRYSSGMKYAQPLSKARAEGNITGEVHFNGDR